MDVAAAQLLARYNRWQNAAMFGAAGALVDAERRRERGAFFGSIHATLNHLLWADLAWMSRFAGTPKPRGGIPESTVLHGDWAELHSARTACDATIIAWADALRDEWLAGSTAWFSSAAGREVAKPNTAVVQHFFNHQTHHRGQVHCLLSQAGAPPYDTDLWLLPDAP